MSSILGVLFAAFAALMMLGQVMNLAQQSAADRRAVAAAEQLQQITTGAQAYVLANGAEIEAVATATGAATVTVPQMQAAGVLAPTVSATNAYGQTWELQVLQPQPGVLQGLVLSQGGNAIATPDASRVAAMAGGLGGFVPQNGELGTLSSAVAQGAYGGWQVSLAGYTNPGPGHLAGLLAFSNGSLTNDYLYRGAVPGQPQLNTMDTDLNMGDQSITNANNLQAQTATLASGNVNGQPGALQIGSAHYYGDGQNSAVRQTGTFFVQNQDGSGSAPINTGDVTSSGKITAETATLGNTVVNPDGAGGLAIQNQSGDLGGLVVGNVLTSGDLVAGGVIQPGLFGAYGEPCATTATGTVAIPNGAIGASIDGSGAQLVCVNGIWTTPLPTNLESFVLTAQTAFLPGLFRYCSYAGGDMPAFIAPVTNAGDGSFGWEISTAGTTRVNCF